MRTGSQAGFTLIELVVTVTVAIILLTMAVPNVMGTLKSNRLIAESNNLVQALHLARSHALRSGSATVCASADKLTCVTAYPDGPIGYIVLDNKNNVVRAYDAPAPAIVMQSAFIGVTFGNVGNATPIMIPPDPTVPVNLTGTEFTIDISSCESTTSTDANVRKVIVLVSGKLVTQKYTCSGVLVS